MKKMNADRLMTAIFCDDIRHEVGNKRSFMGCYENELFVQSMPFVLSKFCIYASALTLTKRPFKTLAFRVIQDDDIELVRLDIPENVLEQSAHTQDATATRQIVSAAITFSPFSIEKPTLLRLLAITEEGEIVGPRLLIKIAVGQELPSALPIDALAVDAPKPKKRKSPMQKN
jgi:hypothetical protein